MLNQTLKKSSSNIMHMRPQSNATVKPSGVPFQSIELKCKHKSSLTSKFGGYMNRECILIYLQYFVISAEGWVGACQHAAAKRLHQIKNANEEKRQLTCCAISCRPWKKEGLA